MRKPAPTPLFRLSHFTVPRQLVAGCQHWGQITAWQRGGLLSVKPTRRDQVTVMVTDAGRLAISEGKAT